MSTSVYFRMGVNKPLNPGVLTCCPCVKQPALALCVNCTADLPTNHCTLAGVVSDYFLCGSTIWNQTYVADKQDAPLECSWLFTQNTASCEIRQVSIFEGNIGETRYGLTLSNGVADNYGIEWTVVQAGDRDCTVERTFNIADGTFSPQWGFQNPILVDQGTVNFNPT